MHNVAETFCFKTCTVYPRKNSYLAQRQAVKFSNSLG